MTDPPPVTPVPSLAFGSQRGASPGHFSRCGGEGEIRTHEPREGLPVFKTGAFNRSATSPAREQPGQILANRARSGRVRACTGFRMALIAPLAENRRPTDQTERGMTDSPDNSARDHYDVLIVGAGHGGAQAALSLRQFKFAGSIALLGDEREPPYERPPLSKDYFAGEKSFERILIRPVAQWAQRETELLPGRRVTGVDAAAHRVTLADGTGIGYDALIWAAGGSPRRLPCPGSALSGVHAVRTRADVDAILKELPSTQQVVVIGGGYIGLEAAAVLSKFGKRVTLLEAQDRVLARVAGEPLSRFYEHEHRVHGVDVRVGIQVTALEGTDGRVSAVRLADGTLLGTDLVIVGIGIIPAVKPLRAAGAAGSDGVDVDAQCRTSLPDVFAIGDCGRHQNAFAGGERIPLGSVQNSF